MPHPPRYDFRKYLYNTVTPDDYSLENIKNFLLGRKRKTLSDPASEEAWAIYNKQPYIEKYFTKKKQNGDYKYNNFNFENDLKKYLLENKNNSKYSLSGITVNEFDLYPIDSINNPARPLGSFTAGVDTTNNKIWYKDIWDIDPLKRGPLRPRGNSTVENSHNSMLNLGDKLINSFFNPFNIKGEIPIKQNNLQPGEKMKQKEKIKKYKSGGFIKGLGNTIKDFGMYQLDNVTSIINPDIIDSSNYDTKFFKGASNFTGGLINKAAPIAANALLPGSGYAVSAIQGMSKSFVPEDKERITSDSNIVSEGLSSGLNYIPFDKMFKSVPTFNEGGMINRTLINTEKGELLVDSKGKILKEYNGFPLHPKEGIDPRGNTIENEGNLVIPRKYAKLYKNSRYNSPERNTIVMNVLKNQSEKETMENLKMYKEGGKIYIKPENRGKFTAYAKSRGMSVQEAAKEVLANKSQHSSALIKRANFARNASRWKHKDGGIIKKYINGGEIFDTDMSIRPLTFNTSLNYSPGISFPKGSSFGMPLKTGYDRPFFNSDSVDLRLKENKYSEYENLNSEKIKDDGVRPWYENAGEFLMNSAGPLYNLFAYTKPQPVSYPRVTPKYLSPDAALSDADVQSRTSWRNLKNVAGGNAGLYLSNLNTVSSENARRKYLIRSEYDNKNAEIDNKINTINAEIGIRERDAYDANLGKYHETKSQSVSKLGTNAAEAWKGRNVNQRDLETLKYLKRVYPDLFK